MAIKQTKRAKKPSKVVKKPIKVVLKSKKLTKKTLEKIKTGTIKAPKEIKWKESSEGKYTLSIFMNDEVYATKTDDVYNSLKNFTPTKITNKVIITLREGKKYAEKVMRVFPARRTFSQPLATQFVAKNLILRLK